MASRYQIKLNYTPGVTLEFLESVANEDFPECEIKTHWGIPNKYLIIRQNKYVQANIMVRHNIRANKTKIVIVMNVKPSTQFWLGLIAYIIHYNRRGDFGDQVEDTIREALHEKLGVKW